MSPFDPVSLAFLVLIVAIVGWNHAQLRSLNQRLSSLEKQHLALVQELEERLFPSG